MKIAFVVQRYGMDINGGAELHCRWVAEHMQKHWETHVLTTKARDYITWKDHYPSAQEEVNGVQVLRFPVARTRDPERFGKLQRRILDSEHSSRDELEWLKEEGPYSPDLIEYIRTHEGAYDYFVFFSYRYYHSYWGIRAVPHKSILVPTAERDAVIHLHLFKELFRAPRAFVYNSVEERDMIRALSGNGHIPGDVVGVGTELPEAYSEAEFRSAYGLEGDYLIYIGRIDENKGCPELFDFFLRFKRETGSGVRLVLMGSSVIKIPAHPDILYLGFLPDQDKFAALQGALVLCMPSFYESLSMVTLEAWAMEKPVLANARCDVLRGQALRSRAGLYYANYEEFRDALRLLLADGRLRQSMGTHGRRYFSDHYTWDAIEGKYLDLVRRVSEA
ncbi:MAG: glycosyltransferase family 4 protein [Candidatus Aminicenantaceae bacterium]